MCVSENGAKVLLFFIPAKYLSTSVLSDKKHIKNAKSHGLLLLFFLPQLTRIFWNVLTNSFW